MEKQVDHKKELKDLVNVAKSDVTNHIKIRMLQTNPEWSSLITRRLILDALVFVDGFGSCLIEYTNPPYNKDDIQGFLKDEAFSYIYRRIEASTQT